MLQHLHSSGLVALLLLAPPLAACSGAEFGAAASDAGTGLGGANGSGGARADAGTPGDGGRAGGGSGASGSGGVRPGTGGSRNTGGATTTEGGIVTPGESGVLLPAEGGGVVGSEAGTGTPDASVPSDASGTCGGIGDCSRGSYCNRSTAQCEPCGDVARFRFGLPQKITAVSGTPAGNQRWPRVTHNGVEMFFGTGAWNVEKDLWIIPDFAQNAGIQQFGAPVDVAGESVEGPLEMTVSVTGFGSANFFFHRSVGGPNARRVLYAGMRSGGTNVAAAIPIPSPINDPASTQSNYSLAMSPDRSRVWWMSNRAGQAELWSVSTTGSGALQPATVTLPLGGTSGCNRMGGDATAWVTPDGSVMLFRTIEIASSTCAAQVDANDLWMVPLDDQGQAASPASLLSDVSQPGMDDTDPSLSPDRCWLYFASDGGAAAGWEYDVYRAPRE